MTNFLIGTIKTWAMSTLNYSITFFSFTLLFLFYCCFFQNGNPRQCCMGLEHNGRNQHGKEGMRTTIHRITEAIASHIQNLSSLSKINKQEYVKQIWIKITLLSEVQIYYQLLTAFCATSTYCHRTKFTVQVS